MSQKQTLMGDSGWSEQQPNLRGAEVMLRAWESRDIDAVFEACQDPDIQQWTTVPSPYLREHAVDFVRSFAPQEWRNRNGAAFCVAASDSDRVLGACGLVAVDLAAQVAEVGYWIAAAERGSGVAAAAIRLLADWAFNEAGMRRLELYIEPGNSGSIAAAERVGCVHEGLVRNRNFGGAERRDSLLLVLTNHESRITNHE